MTLKTPLVPFQSGSPIIISGPTGSGKTYWTHKLLSNEMLTEHVLSILYCYGVYQSYFNQMKDQNLEFHEGLPSREKVETLNDGKFHIIVLDDLMEQIVKSVETQNLFINTVIIIISLLFFYPKIFLLKDLVPELLTLILTYW